MGKKSAKSWESGPTEIGRIERDIKKSMVASLQGNRAAFHRVVTLSKKREQLLGNLSWGRKSQSR